MPDHTKNSTSWRRWWNAALIPISALLLVATVYLWHQNQLFDQDLAILRATMQEQQDEIDENQRITDLMAQTDTMVVALAHQAGQQRGQARIVYNVVSGTLAYYGQLERAPVDKSYELWLIPANGNALNAGVSNPRTGKTSHWVIKMPPGTVPKLFTVTLEPVGGAAQPTGPKILVGVPST